MKYLFTILFFAFFLNTSYSQPPDDFLSATLKFRFHKYDEALDLYLDVAKKHPSYEKHFVEYRIAYCYVQTEQYKKAKKYFNKALKVKPDYKDYERLKGDIYWMQGRMYSKLGDEAKCLELSYKALTYIKDDSALYSNIALSEVILGKYEDALKNINISINLNEDNPYAYSNRSLILLRLSRLEEARIDAIKAMEMAPKNPYAYKHSAMIYIAQKEYNKACKDLHKAEELGYKDFGDEIDQNDVENLIEEHCKKVVNKAPPSNN